MDDTTRQQCGFSTDLSGTCSNHLQSHHGALRCSAPFQSVAASVPFQHGTFLCSARAGLKTSWTVLACVKDAFHRTYLNTWRDDCKGSKASVQRLPEKKHVGTKLFGERSHCLQLNHTKAGPSKNPAASRDAPSPCMSVSLAGSRKRWNESLRMALLQLVPSEAIGLEAQSHSTLRNVS